MNLVFWAVAGVLTLLFSVVGLVIWSIWLYNIPVTILKYTGDKRRPMMIHRKARKKIVNGVVNLWVRGYRTPVRDFLSHNYYPSPKTKHGGLLLFEFEDGNLTPLRPTLNDKRYAPEQLAKIKDIWHYLQEGRVVDFDFSDDMLKQLRLKIVDDVDADFFVQNLARQHKQYQSSFDRFMAVLPWGVLTFIFLCILVGWIMWIKENPTNAAQACVSNIKPLLEQAANRVVPPG